MARSTRKTKAEQTAELVAAAVGAGEKVRLPTVDFSDPDRPKTCLEVDFPILPINQIAQIEGNAGKPIYQMSKWWARRRSSVFRSTLIAAATRAPDDPLEAARTVWDAYYANHQSNEAFRKLKVADIFMGGGTTLVEGARLGMQMFGNDLNPVAWFVVKNELAQVDIDEVQKLFDLIEREVKPQIMPFYACEGPGGERGTWTRIETGEVMDEDFDPLALTPEERKAYSYDGPEVIYTFWAKHGPCSAPGCGHRTPLFTSPVIAIKTLTVKVWRDFDCASCHKPFDIELQEARMAPDVPLVVADDEEPYAIMDAEGRFACPHCGASHQDEIAALNKGDSSRFPKRGWKKKKVSLSLLIHPDWMRGAGATDGNGNPLGGTATSGLEATRRWHDLRGSTLRLLEVRGKLPEQVTCPETDVIFSTSVGTIPKTAKFACFAPTCGLQQPIVNAVEHSGSTAPIAEFALQCFSPGRNKSGAIYNGRYFKPLSSGDVDRFNAAAEEWDRRSKTDLSAYWPIAEIPFGHMTHQRQPLPQHGYTHYWKLFNPRQLLIHAQILKTIDTAHGFSDESMQVVLGAFQQYLRNQCMFSFWHIKADKLASFMSNANFHPKNLTVESAVFPKLGLGNWESCQRSVIDALYWKQNPTELVPTSELLAIDEEFAGLVSGKSEKVYPADPVLPNAEVICSSSTELRQIDDSHFDLVITDPPFGGLVHYSELADFFHVWLRLFLRDKHPEYFAADYSPKTLEAVSNRARNAKDPDAFYKRVLTSCWSEAFRILKPGGTLAFTFHHSEDEPWVDVLESLFDSGFYLEATYPIRSDETKGKGEFGSKTIEYDIIHVCRKRTKEPERISWPRLRRQILADVRQLQELLEHHQRSGLPKADIQVIKRGKALEYFSRHYGQVYVEQGREFTVKEALAGINDILDEEIEGEISTPVNCEPMTRQFLRIFAKQAEVPRDQMQKFLRGSGIGPSEFADRDWCFEKRKTYFWVSPMEFAKAHADKAHALNRDLDQALLLVGAFHPESGVSSKRILTDGFRAHPALGALLDWLIHNHPEAAARHAASSARTRYYAWAAQHQSTVQEQLKLFDLEDAP